MDCYLLALLRLLEIVVLVHQLELDVLLAVRLLVFAVPGPDEPVQHHSRLGHELPQQLAVLLDCEVHPVLGLAAVLLMHYLTSALSGCTKQIQGLHTKLKAFECNTKLYLVRDM